MTIPMVDFLGSVSNDGQNGPTVATLTMGIWLVSMMHQVCPKVLIL